MEKKVAKTGDLQNGQMREVMVGERPVLLAKVEDEFYALESVCPHYGGPLPEGTLHKNRITCPWHQAGFDVKTGDLLEPPAFDGLSKFKVRIENNAVYVTVPEDAPGRVTMPMCDCDTASDNRVFAIIGGGAAGGIAAETLRQEGYRGRIVLISHENRLPYDRPNCTKGYLAGEPPSPSAWLPVRSPDFYQLHHIELIYKHVTNLDITQRTIGFVDGSAMSADAILVATGGSARNLSIPGEDMDNVFTLRSLDDCNAIISATRHAKNAVIVGNSFIGMEAAASLTHRGIAVTVVAPDSVPFEKSLGKEIGNTIKKIHEENGVTFKLGRVLKGIYGEAGRVKRVELDDGSSLETDMVIVGIGIQLNTNFIKGISLNKDGSVNVDNHFHIANHVYAAGDIANYPEPYLGERVRIEHWRVALQHGRAAAKSMVGQGEPFKGVPFFWTEQFNAAFAYVGHAHTWDELLIFGNLEKLDFMSFYVKNNRILAAISSHSDRLGAFTELIRIGKLPPADVFRGKTFIDLNEILKVSEPDYVKTR